MTLTSWQVRSRTDGPPAQIEFKRRSRLTRVDESDVRDERFETVDRIREPPSYRHKVNYTGFYWAATTRGHVWFESLYEKAALMQLDRDPGVTAISAQPMWIYWGGRTPLQHAPDFFVRFRSGPAALIDVKPASRIKPGDVVKFDRTRMLCERLGWQYFVVDDIGDDEARNLRFLSGYRYARWRDERCVKLLREHAGESARLSSWVELLRESCAEPLGAIYAALWWRDLRFDPARHLSLTTMATAA